MSTSTASVTKAAKRLNDHCAKFCAGFYPSHGCSRAFGARVRKGKLEITSDFETWIVVDLSLTVFRNHVGRKIHL